MEEKHFLLNCKGQRYKAKILNVPVEGHIQVENGIVFLCQNMLLGYSCKDMLGYKYSWIVLSKTPEMLIADGITEFSFS